MRFSSGNRTTVKRPIYGVALLSEYVKGRGGGPEPLLEGSGIRAEDLNDHAKLITVQQELTVIKNLVRLLPDPRLGLEIARNTTVSANAYITIPAMFCDTFLDAIRLMFEYIELSLANFRYTLLVDAGKAVLHMKELFDFGEFRRIVFELELASVYSIGTNILGEPLVLKTIHIAYPPPAYASFYQELFRCPIAFNARRHEIIFDSRYLSRRLPQANPLVRDAYEKECKRAHARIREQGGVLEKIRHELLIQGRDVISFQKLAGRLNMSPRTLRRHLAAENSSYKSLVNDFLKSKALGLLENTDYSLEKIAEELGYSSASNFCHAFKSWTGHPPSSYRRKKPDPA
ncbi:MAG: AraC family transcriptional regulator [Thermodesulfobacteriota bacterium]